MIKIIDNFLMPHEYENIRKYYEGELDDGTQEGSCNWQFIPGCV